MKKCLSLALALVMVFSLSVTAFAEGPLPRTLYVDISKAMDSSKAIQTVSLEAWGPESQSAAIEADMTHVSGTIYSYAFNEYVEDGDISFIYIVLHYTDGTATGETANQISATSFEEGKDLYTLKAASGERWSVYTPAPAGPTVTNGTQNVTGKYVAAESDPVYKVDISWGSMAFTYTAASKGTWSTSNHTYENGTQAAWSWANGANKITVTNHSNADVSVTPVYTADSAYTSVAMKFDKGILMMPTADNGSDEEAGTATTGTITAIPSGDLPENTNGKIGQITLKLEPPTTISTAEDLAAALQNGGAYKLDNDITLTEAFNIQKNVALDLNHCTVTATQTECLVVQNSGNLTLVNGTVTAVVKNDMSRNPITSSGNVFAENCTLTGYMYALNLYGGTATVKDCTMNGLAYATNGSTMTLLGNFTWNMGILGTESTKGICALGGGTVICDFDPTNYMARMFDGTVTDNGDGTWTATKQ